MSNTEAAFAAELGDQWQGKYLPNVAMGILGFLLCSLSTFVANLAAELEKQFCHKQKLCVCHKRVWLIGKGRLGKYLAKVAMRILGVLSVCITLKQFSQQFSQPRLSRESQDQLVMSSNGAYPNKKGELREWTKLPLKRGSLSCTLYCTLFILYFLTTSTATLATVLKDQ